jgi:hypothetical protein
VYGQPGLNMLNTKYFILKSDQPPLENKGALGNAWFVSSIKLVENADSEIAAVHNFDPKRQAVIDVRYKDKVNGINFSSDDSSSAIILTEYKPNHLIYNSSSSSERLAVFSEIYYDKGWNAYIDGKPSDYVRADYVLRAMRIPAGNHTIEFKFEPEVIHTGERIAFASSLILILMFGFTVYKEVRDKSKVNS